MSELTHKKMAMAFALFSFGVVVFGSIFSGATYVTAFVRGTEAGVLFGLLAYGLGAMLVEKVDVFADLENQKKMKDSDKTEE